MPDTDTAGVVLGARHYRHRSWRSALYPDNLPAEWRFLFYSHRHTGLLMPYSLKDASREALALWQEESPPGFRMVLEIGVADLEWFAQRPVPRPFVGACVVRGARLDEAHLPDLAGLAARLPVAVDVRSCAPALARELAARGIGRCGRPAQNRPPTGPAAVSLIASPSRPLIGQALTALWAAPAESRYLFFCEAASALRALADARVLAGFINPS